MNLPQDARNNDYLVKNAIRILVHAGKIAATEYAVFQSSKEKSFTKKNDMSPVTNADKIVNDYLHYELAKTFDIPVVSEEDTNKSPQQSSQKLWFVIDPIDGTKGFIAGTDDFVINVALVDSDTPIAGFIYSPLEKRLWYADLENQAYRREADGIINKINVSKRIKNRVGVSSREHLKEDDLLALKKLGCKDISRRGSALKFCFIADGSADAYVRLSRTMVWDTAAAHALVHSAGGYIYYLQSNGGFSSRPPQESSAGFVCINNRLAEDTLRDLVV